MTPDNRSFDGGGLVRRLFAAALAGLLAGCASQPGTVGNGLQPDILPGARFEAKTLAGDGLPVRYWQPVGPMTEKQLVVYLEGDGRAWASRTIISADPTPVKPLAMWLARADGRPNVAYLARPCQYGGAGQSPCSPRYWSSHRFAPKWSLAFRRHWMPLKPPRE